MESDKERKTRARKINTRLKKAHSDATIALEFSNPLELLVATILSAQCTDTKVNEVTKNLFEKYKTAADYASASQKQFEKEIKPTGFFRNKAENILKCCREVVEKYGGEVPRSMEELTELPGIGRKTANVVLGNAFSIPGIVVDTHVKRVSNRLGLTENSDPVKIEADLCELIPKKEWTDFSHRMIFHGRRICAARKPKCPECPVEKLCPYEEKTEE
jgi:endonuclease-3